MIRRWSLVAWLVFWGVLVAVLSITLLVQAREQSDAGQVREPEDTVVQVQQWVPFMVQEGIATWYGPGFHGRRTASGRRYDMYDLTAAHRALPFGTLVRVSVPGGDTVLVVQITDRGPFIRRRIIDLSWAAAKALGVRRHPVRIEAFLPPQDSALILGFDAHWRPYSVQRRAFTLVDTLQDWTEAVRLWGRFRQAVPEAWLLVGWEAGIDSASSQQPHRLWFHLGVPRLRQDSLLALLRSG
jgi:hypothetical protein